MIKLFTVIETVFGIYIFITIFEKSSKILLLQKVNINELLYEIFIIILGFNHSHISTV